MRNRMQRAEQKADIWGPRPLYSVPRVRAEGRTGARVPLLQGPGPEWIAPERGREGSSAGEISELVGGDDI